MLEYIVVLLIGFVLGFAVGYRTPHPAEIIDVQKERKSIESRQNAEIVETENPLDKIEI